MTSYDKKKTISLTTEIAFKIKDKRIKLGYTQTDVAAKVGISSKKYSRIETMKMSFIDYNLLMIIAEILDIDIDELHQKYDTRVSFSISNDLKKELEFLKDLKDFSTLSDTVKYCIEFTLYEFYKEKVSINLLDELKEMLNSTYNDQLSKLSLQNNIKDIILKNFSNNNDFELQEIEEELRNIFMKYYHAKRDK